MLVNDEFVYEYVFEACRENFEYTTRSFWFDSRYDIHNKRKLWKYIFEAYWFGVWGAL